MEVREQREQREQEHHGHRDGWATAAPSGPAETALFAV